MEEPFIFVVTTGIGGSAVKKTRHFVDVFVERTTKQCRIPNCRSLIEERAEDDGHCSGGMLIFLLSDFC